MSVLFNILFIGLGALAVLAIARSIGHAIAHLSSLRAALREPTSADELRLTVREHRVFARSLRGPLRHRHGPKPVTHRLGSLRRIAA